MAFISNISIGRNRILTGTVPTQSPTTGTYFDHIVIVAMENTPYASVFGSGTLSDCPTSTAPFLCSLLSSSATIPSMNNYGATASDGNDFSGCSAACYVGLLAGYTYGISDGYGGLTAPNLAGDRLGKAGLTWQAYCAEGCPRGNDHFPFAAFTDTSGSSIIFASSSVTTSSLVATANSANPPNFLWYTPTDAENMHDVSVSTGDSYLKSFLVGTGSINSPASGSLLASKLFTNTSYRTVLYLWWDECGGSNGSCDANNDTPNLLYGSPVKKGYVSPDKTGIDEYASLWTIENNWGLAPLAQGDIAAKTNGYSISDVFTTASSSSLSANFTFAPNIAVVNAIIDFTGIGAGGTLPYTYIWNFGDGLSGTGPLATHVYTSPGNYTVSLRIADSGSSTATSSKTITVTSSSTSPPPCTNGTTNPPVCSVCPSGQILLNGVCRPNSSTSSSAMIGWGGVRLDESLAGSSGTVSAVFPGEYASIMELLLVHLKAMSYNTVRVEFDPYCTDTSDFNYMSVYSQTNAQRAVQIAQHYGFWIILDYHGYSDIFRNTSCWLTYWKPIVQNIGPLYSQIIWEPENEPTLDCINSPLSCPTAPCSGDATCVTYLSSAYQQWINQTRLLGDTHWIVVQNLCSYSCGFTDMSQGYPTVTDPLGTPSTGGKLFISLHSYMDYGSYASQWTNSTAESVAEQYYQAVLAGVANNGWVALNTEGGTDPLCTTICPPDTVLSGSAGYSVVTFHFIQTLVNLYDHNTPQRINWIWWPVGSWANATGTSIYGAVSCGSRPENWGCLLSIVPIGSNPSFRISSNANNLSVMQSFSKNIRITLYSLAGYADTINLAGTVTGPTVTLGLNPNSTSLPAGLSRNVTLTILTSYSTPVGNYTVTVTAADGSTVQTLAILVAVNVLGDIIAKGTVNAIDIAIVYNLYGSRIGSPNWNPLADLNHDGVVDAVDFSIVKANYGM